MFHRCKSMEEKIVLCRVRFIFLKLMNSFTRTASEIHAHKIDFIVFFLLKTEHKFTAIVQRKQYFIWLCRSRAKYSPSLCSWSTKCIGRELVPKWNFCIFVFGSYSNVATLAKAIFSTLRYIDAYIVLHFILFIHICIYTEKEKKENKIYAAKLKPPQRRREEEEEKTVYHLNMYTRAIQTQYTKQS